MKKKYLIFNLYGAMAAWGDIAVGEMRPSHAYPTKSGICGLISAALGIKRDEEEQLQKIQNGLGFAVRLDIEGRLLIDYHTTQVPTKASLKKQPHNTRREELLIANLGTILSTREYYCDAYYTIVLWQRDKEISLIDLKDKIKQPSFMLYLGRKSCPLGLPLLPYLCDAENIEEALEHFHRDESSQKFQRILHHLFTKGMNNKTSASLRFYTDIDVDTKSQSYQHTAMRRDQLFNRQRWQYSEREEKLFLQDRPQDMVGE